MSNSPIDKIDDTKQSKSAQRKLRFGDVNTRVIHPHETTFFQQARIVTNEQFLINSYLDLAPQQIPEEAPSTSKTENESMIQQDNTQLDDIKERLRALYTLNSSTSRKRVNEKQQKLVLLNKILDNPDFNTTYDKYGVFSENPLEYDDIYYNHYAMYWPGRFLSRTKRIINELYTIYDEDYFEEFCNEIEDEHSDLFEYVYFLVEESDSNHVSWPSATEDRFKMQRAFMRYYSHWAIFADEYITHMVEREAEPLYDIDSLGIYFQKNFLPDHWLARTTIDTFDQIKNANRNAPPSHVLSKKTIDEMRHAFYSEYAPLFDCALRRGQQFDETILEVFAKQLPKIIDIVNTLLSEKQGSLNLTNNDNKEMKRHTLTHPDLLKAASQEISPYTTDVILAIISSLVKSKEQHQNWNKARLYYVEPNEAMWVQRNIECSREHHNHSFKDRCEVIQGYEDAFLRPQLTIIYRRRKNYREDKQEAAQKLYQGMNNFITNIEIACSKIENNGPLTEIHILRVINYILNKSQQFDLLTLSQSQVNSKTPSSWYRPEHSSSQYADEIVDYCLKENPGFVHTAVVPYYPFRFWQAEKDTHEVQNNLNMLQLL